MEIYPGAKCHFCTTCDGRGCIGELPGMGGVFSNANFISNCADWKKYKAEGNALPAVRLAPITGALQNIGYRDEKSFYIDIINASVRAGLRLSVGSGYPDEKLLFGLEALSAAGKKGAVFLKPYETETLYERIDWSLPVAEIIGIDIDAYAIVTMRNQINLQQKTAKDLIEARSYAKKPFAIKGIFREADIQLVKDVRPEIIVISNHGGRVENGQGSSVDFLARYGKELSNYCGEIWVDGGIRTGHDLLVAAQLGATEAMIARPFITALLRDRENGIKNRLAEFKNSL